MAPSTTKICSNIVGSIDNLMMEACLSAFEKLKIHLDEHIEMEGEISEQLDQFEEKLKEDLSAFSIISHLKPALSTNVTKGKRGGKREDTTPKKKRAPSAYNLFIKEKMAEIKEQDSSLSAKERMRQAIALWKERTPDAKNAPMKSPKVPDAPVKELRSFTEENDVPVQKKTKNGAKKGGRAPKGVAKKLVYDDEE
jgi:hypothetical protein